MASPLMIGRRGCARFRDRLAAAVDTASEPADFVLYQHLRSCPPCRSRLNAYRRTRRELFGLGAVDVYPLVQRRPTLHDHARTVAAVAGAVSFAALAGVSAALRHRRSS